jgi:hypothetical protein
MILSFLFSVFLFAGIAFFIVIDIFDLSVAISVFPQQVQIFVVPAFFLTLFLIIFIYLILRQDSEEEDIPFLTVFDTLELIEAGEAVGLEDISPGSGGNSMFRQLFAFSPANPELLQDAENEVIYEHNGIHYINDDAFNSDKNTENKMNNDFAELVESVINQHTSP